MDAPDNREEALTRFRKGTALLEAAVRGLDEERLDAMPPGGGWTIRQIVHHVADGDDLWKLGIKIALGSDQAGFSLAWYQGQSQGVWADRWAYASRPIGPSLSLLRSGREQVLQLLEHVPDAWHREVTCCAQDGRTERVSVGFVIGMQADHLLRHLARVRDTLNGPHDVRPWHNNPELSR